VTSVDSDNGILVLYDVLFVGTILHLLLHGCNISGSHSRSESHR
jgi:hypothetical protein